MLPIGWLVLTNGPLGELIYRLVGGILIGVGFIGQGWALWSSQQDALWQAATDAR